MKQVSRPVYSVVIPTYNEEPKKEEMRLHLKLIDDFFKGLGQTHEVVIVLDGPTDKTPELVRMEAEKYDAVKVINRKQNKGKGFSVREGLMASQGQIRLFTDMDGATPIETLSKMIPKFQEGYDIVIGSRDAEGAKIKAHQPKWKEVLGDFGNLLIQFGTGLWGMRDTQCGFKALNEKAVNDIVPRMKVDRWGFDFELLMIGNRLDYKITEVPVDWTDMGESLVGISGYLSTFKDLFRVKMNILKGSYYLGRKIEDIEKKREV